MYAHVLAYFKAQLDEVYERENQVSKEFRRLTAEVSSDNRHFYGEHGSEKLRKWFEVRRELDSIGNQKLKLLLRAEERVKRLHRLTDYQKFYNGQSGCENTWIF